MGLTWSKNPKTGFLVTRFNNNLKKWIVREDTEYTELENSGRSLIESVHEQKSIMIHSVRPFPRVLTVLCFQIKCSVHQSKYRTIQVINKQTGCLKHGSKEKSRGPYEIVLMTNGISKDTVLIIIN